MTPTKCPAREKKKRQEKRKKKGGEKQADVLHLDQKAAKCTTCKPVCGKF